MSCSAQRMTRQLWKFVVLLFVARGRRSYPWPTIIHRSDSDYYYYSVWVSSLRPSLYLVEEIALFMESFKRWYLNWTAQWLLEYGLACPFLLVRVVWVNEVLCCGSGWVQRDAISTVLLITNTFGFFSKYYFQSLFDRLSQFSFLGLRAQVQSNEVIPMLKNMYVCND